jgi:hypothetical protein
MSAASGMLLFLDTPRASGGLNHRFLVASADAGDEQRIVHYSQAARAAEAGDDYLAVSRPAEQVLDGQTRTGLELLVLAGISTGDSARTNALRARLEEMLHSLPDGPVVVDGAVNGLLIQDARIAAFERELRERATPPASSTTSPARSRHVVRNALLVGIPALVIPFAATRKPKEAGQVPPTGVEKTSIFQREDRARQAWSFLDEPDWSKLARLTGLPQDANPEAIASWAARLLKEADPDGTPAVTPEEVRQNTEVLKLLSSVQAHGENAEALSKAWLNALPANDQTGLLEFWRALEAKHPRRASHVKIVLAKWERAIGELAQGSTPGAEALRGELSAFKTISAPAVEALPPVQILVEADRRRFERVNAFLASRAFGALAKQSDSGTEWESRDWEFRLMKLPKLSTDHNREFPDDVRRLCEKLNAALASQVHGGRAASGRTQE